MKKLRNRSDLRHVGNEKDYLKWTSKLSCMSHIIFDNDLIAIGKSKATLTLAYVRMCILDLRIVLMGEFHDDNIKNKYGNNPILLFTNTDSLMYGIKTEDIYEDFSKDKDMFEFSNCSVRWKYYDNWNKLVVGRMKDETAGVAVK